MTIITTSLKNYTTEFASQSRAAKELKLSQPAISLAISRDADIRVTFDNVSLKIIECYEISPFGTCQDYKQWL